MTALKTYLEQTGEKQSAFAERVNTSPATISRLCAGTLKPALDLAHRIEMASRGCVPMRTWVEADQQDAECQSAGEAA